MSVLTLSEIVSMMEVNYLTIAEIDNGLLINFSAAERLEIKRKYRVYNPHI